MNPQIVIALYKPHEGKDAELRALIDQQASTLRKLEFITDRPGVLARSKNGTYVEIFEWRDSRPAHEHPEVARIWGAMEQVADLPSLDSLEEASRIFPYFAPIG